MPIAIITARGGSKRIPRKNIKPFCGRPMISYVIETALASNCFDHVVVSTEDEEIAAISRAHGATTPFKRPQSLADDLTSTGPVVTDAIKQLQGLGITDDYYCCLYPTAPLILASDLSASFHLLMNSKTRFVFSIGNFGHPIQRALRLDSKSRVSAIYPDNMIKRSQDLEPTFHDAGQFYWGTLQGWLSSQSIFSGDAIGYHLPRHRLVDIDTEEDWVLAENLYRAART